MAEEALLPPTAGDGRQRLPMAANSWPNNGWSNIFCGLNHEIRQRLDLQMPCCPSCRPTGARELCDEPHAAVRQQWSGMLQEPAKQQLKTCAGIRPPGRLLAIAEIEDMLCTMADGSPSNIAFGTATSNTNSI